MSVMPGIGAVEDRKISTRSRRGMPVSHLSTMSVAGPSGWAMRCMATVAVYPPTMGEQPLNAGILDLATHEVCGATCRHVARWALTPPFHPCRRCGGNFLSHCSAVAGRLPLTTMVLYVARTFLLPLMMSASD